MKACNEIEATWGRVFRPNWGDHALYLEEADGTIVSLLVWREWRDGDANCAWIGVAWTHPGYRRRGLYRALYAALKVLAKERGFETIGARVALDNQVSREVHLSFGMKPFMFEERL